MVMWIHFKRFDIAPFQIRLTAEHFYVNRVWKKAERLSILKQLHRKISLNSNPVHLQITTFCNRSESRTNKKTHITLLFFNIETSQDSEEENLEARTIKVSSRSAKWLVRTEWIKGTSRFIMIIMMIINFKDSSDSEGQRLLEENRSSYQIQPKNI